MKFLPVCFFLFVLSTVKAQTPKASELINKMVESVAKLKTYQFTMFTSERNFDNTYHEGNSFNKVNVSPYAIYMKILAQKNRGTEILYNESKYGKSGIINAGKLIPNLKLDPFGSIMRKDQHHTILEGGFKYSVDLLNALKTKFGDDFDAMAKVDKEVLFSNHLCYRITLIDNNFSYVNYTMKSGETFYSIANQKKISEFLIVYHNKNVSDYWDYASGKVIQIPTDFAKKAIIYIDNVSFHPIGIEMYDDIGMFEKYEFRNVVYNPSFASDEFTKEYSAYGF